MPRLTEEEVAKVERFLAKKRCNLPNGVTNITFDRERGIVVHHLENGKTEEVPARHLLTYVIPFSK